MKPIFSILFALLVTTAAHAGDDEFCVVSDIRGDQQAPSTKSASNGADHLGSTAAGIVGPSAPLAVTLFLSLLGKVAEAPVPVPIKYKLARCLKEDEDKTAVFVRLADESLTVGDRARLVFDSLRGSGYSIVR